ncbi:hypothetical protein ACETU7_30160 [Rhodococcus sp. 3Y1]
MLQEGSLDVLAAAARSGSRESMASLYAAFRPMVVLRCRAELDQAVSDSAADAACVAVLTAVCDGSETYQPFYACCTRVQASRLLGRHPTGSAVDRSRLRQRSRLSNAMSWCCG